MQTEAADSLSSQRTTLRKLSEFSGMVVGGVLMFELEERLPNLGQ